MIVWIIFGSLGCESSKCHHTQYFEDNAACRADRKLACCKHCPQQSRKARYRLHDAFGHNSCESTWVTLQRCNSGCFVRGLSERRTGYYGQANKLSAEGSLEGRESNPEVALCLPHRDYWICWRAAIQCRHNLQARIPVPNRSSDPRQRGWGSGLAGMIIKSFKNWDIVRKFRKLTRHKLGPIVTKSHHWRFCFERWEENNGPPSKSERFCFESFRLLQKSIWALSGCVDQKSTFPRKLCLSLALQIRTTPNGLTIR